MRINEIKCKTALSKSTLPGLDYSLNPYRGCQHNCAYCYVPNVLRIKREEWGSFVAVKTNIPVILSKELKKKESGVVGISTVTDPYQPVEKKYKLTRYCLEQLLRYDFPISLLTKSNLISRDIDIISKFSDPEVMLSIGTLNDDERKILEPGSSSINDRLNSLKEFSDIGVKTGVFFGPIYPTIKTEDLKKIMEIFQNQGIKEIMIDDFNLKPGILNNIETTLQNNSNLLQTFSQNIQNIERYKNIRESLLDLDIVKKVKITDAF